MSGVWPCGHVCDAEVRRHRHADQLVVRANSQELLQQILSCLLCNSEGLWTG